MPTWGRAASSFPRRTRSRTVLFFIEFAACAVCRPPSAGPGSALFHDGTRRRSTDLFNASAHVYRHNNTVYMHNRFKVNTQPVPGALGRYSSVRSFVLAPPPFP